MTQRRLELIDVIETEVVWNLQHPDQVCVPLDQVNEDLKLAKDPNIGPRKLTHLFWRYGVA